MRSCVRRKMCATNFDAEILYSLSCISMCLYMIIYMIFMLTYMQYNNLANNLVMCVFVCWCFIFRTKAGRTLCFPGDRWHQLMLQENTAFYLDYAHILALKYKSHTFNFIVYCLNMCCGKINPGECPEIVCRSYWII